MILIEYFISPFLMIVGGSLLAVLTTLNYYALNEEHGDISAPLGIGYFMTDPLK